MRKTARLVNLKTAVEIEINAAIPELRRQISDGVREAIARTDISRMARTETQATLDEMIREEIRNAISECADEIARDHIKSTTRDAVEVLFKKWIDEKKGMPLP